MAYNWSTIFGAMQNATKVLSAVEAGARPQVEFRRIRVKRLGDGRAVCDVLCLRPARDPRPQQAGVARSAKQMQAGTCTGKVPALARRSRCRTSNVGFVGMAHEARG